MPKGNATKLTAAQINATAASLLGFLHEGPTTGWDLVKTAEERIGNFWSLTKSQVYSELHKLANYGLVTVGERGRRESRIFTINSVGRKLFKEWINQNPGREQIRFPLLLSVSFARFIQPNILHSILTAHQVTHQKQLDEYLTLNNLLEKYPQSKDGRMTLSFGIEYERMTLQWIKKVLNNLEEKK